MNTEHEFARQHPALDQALRKQLKGPVMDAAFRRQVLARIATQRATAARVSVPPEAMRSRLRMQLVMQFLNGGALALAAVLVVRAVWPQLAFPQFSIEWALPASLALGAVALLYGLQRARLLDRLRME